MPIRTLRLIVLLCLAPAGGWTAADPMEPTPELPGEHETAVGRWDIEVQDPSGAYPSWLEITQNEIGSLRARFVGRAGSARPVTELHVESGRIRFALRPQFEARGDLLRFEGQLHRNGMKGETTNDLGARVTWSAVRAPALERQAPPTWGRPHTLIASHDLAGWRARGDGDDSCWNVDEGTLFTTGPCSDLVTERKYMDFKLALEFMLEPGSDSGVHLRGRYEIQLKDDVGGMPEAVNGLTGSLYGLLPPLRPATRKPGEWQTLEATLIGRTLTVVLNGQTVIDEQEIPGITGDALDSNEGTPGPIMLQGYLGPVSYRNIVIAPARYEL